MTAWNWRSPARPICCSRSLMNAINKTNPCCLPPMSLSRTGPNTWAIPSPRRPFWTVCSIVRSRWRSTVRAFDNMKAASCSRNIISKPALSACKRSSNPVVTASPWPQDCNSGACLRLKDSAQALYVQNLPVPAGMLRQKKAQIPEKLPVLAPVSIPRKSPGFTASGCVCNHIKYNSITQSGIILHFQVVTFKSGTETYHWLSSKSQR